MTKKPINAVAMTRRIRDQHAHILQHATPAERIAFYQAKAQHVQVQATKEATTEPQPHRKAA